MEKKLPSKKRKSTKNNDSHIKISELCDLLESSDIKDEVNAQNIKEKINYIKNTSNMMNIMMLLYRERHNNIDKTQIEEKQQKEPEPIEKKEVEKTQHESQTQHNDETIAEFIKNNTIMYNNLIEKYNEYIRLASINKIYGDYLIKLIDSLQFDEFAVIFGKFHESRILYIKEYNYKGIPEEMQDNLQKLYKLINYLARNYIASKFMFNVLFGEDSLANKCPA